MSDTDRTYPGSPAILAIGRLALHRETLVNLAADQNDGGAERGMRATFGGNRSGNTGSSGTARCNGPTFNRRCTRTALCSAY